MVRPHSVEETAGAFSLQQGGTASEPFWKCELFSSRHFPITHMTTVFAWPCPRRCHALAPSQDWFHFVPTLLEDEGWQIAGIWPAGRRFECHCSCFVFLLLFIPFASFGRQNRRTAILHRSSPWGGHLVRPHESKCAVVAVSGCRWASWHRVDGPQVLNEGHRSPRPTHRHLAPLRATGGSRMGIACPGLDVPEGRYALDAPARIRHLSEAEG